MKKIVLFFVTVVFATSMVAQDEGFQFGFHISPAISWLGNNADNNAIEGDGSRLAFKIGADGEWYFRENYAVKFGLTMAFSEGGSLKFNNIPVEGAALFADSQPDVRVPAGSTANFNYQYIELPIGLKLRTNELNENMRYFADIPILTFGLNVGSRGSIDGINDGNDFRINDDTYLLQMSWGMGLGAEYSLNDGTGTAITAGFYFQSGFIDTYNGKTGLDAIDDTKTTTRMVELRLGVLF